MDKDDKSLLDEGLSGLLDRFQDSLSSYFLADPGHEILLKRHAERMRGKTALSLATYQVILCSYIWVVCTFVNAFFALGVGLSQRATDYMVLEDVSVSMLNLFVVQLVLRVAIKDFSYEATHAFLRRLVTIMGALHFVYLCVLTFLPPTVSIYLNIHDN